MNITYASGPRSMKKHVLADLGAIKAVGSASSVLRSTMLGIQPNQSPKGFMSLPDPPFQ